MRSVSTLKKKALKVAGLLEQEYGIVEWDHEKHEPLAVLISTILSQNTSDNNSIPAFNSLRKKYSSWKKVDAASQKDLEKVIRRAGLPQQKASRIKSVLKRLKKERGRFTLSHVGRMKPADAKEYLVSFDGIGPKTAAVTLIFGFGLPFLPVDTHVYRVSKRLGLIGGRDSFSKAHEELDELVPNERKMSFHVNMLEHGRRVCLARKPKCGECVLSRCCDYCKGK